MSKNVAILGSTGSIGTNTLRVIDGLGPDYRVTALTAHTSMETLAEQTRKFKPDVVGITSEDHVDRFKRYAEYYARKEGVTVPFLVPPVKAGMVGTLGLLAIGGALLLSLTRE